MSLIKKYAWYGSAVVASLVLAVALLLTAQTTTYAASVTVTVGTGVQNALVGSTVRAGTNLATIDNTSGTALAAGDTITLSFASGWTVNTANVVAADFTIAQAANGGTAGTATAPTAVSSTASSITMTVDAASLSTVTNAGTGVITIALAAGAGGNEIAAPTASGSYTITVSTSAGDSGTAAATVVGVNATPSPASVPGDGISTSVVTIDAASAAVSNGETISISTTAGTFVAVTPGGAADLLAGTCSTPSTAAPATTVSCVAPVSTVTPSSPAAGSVTLRAPGTGAGSATVLVYATPSTGGTARLIATALVTFTTPGVIPGVVASGSVTTPTSGTVSVTTTGTQAVAATFKDANGNTPISGGTVTVTTTLGVLSAPTNGTCLNQSCVGSLPANGMFQVTLTGGGVAGSGTITFATGGVTASNPVVVTGSPATAAASVDMPVLNQSSTTGNLNTANITVTVQDAAGNGVANQTASAAVNSGPAVKVGVDNTAANTALGIPACSAGTNSSGMCNIKVTSSALSSTGTQTITITVTSTLSTTATVTVSQKATTVNVDVGDVQTTGTATVTVTAVDANGNPVADGTSVVGAVSAGAITNCGTTTAGVATCVFVAPTTPQNVTVTAVVGTVVGSKTIAVTGAAATSTPTTGGGTGAGTFDRAIASTGVNTAVWNGGTVDQLSTATAGASGISVTVFVNGQATVLIPGAPSFVNAAFTAAFPNGVPAGTIVLVVK